MRVPTIWPDSSARLFVRYYPTEAAQLSEYSAVSENIPKKADLVKS